MFGCGSSQLGGMLYTAPRGDSDFDRNLLALYKRSPGVAHRPTLYMAAQISRSKAGSDFPAFRPVRLPIIKQKRFPIWELSCAKCCYFLHAHIQ